MFAKQPARTQGKPPGALTALEPPTGRKPAKVASIVADDITFEGNVSGDGELHIDGVVRGDVRVGLLTIGETGHVEGHVFAESVDARGRVLGSITAKTVRLFATAHVDGDIIHEQLTMETGAFFQGRAQKIQPEPPAGGEILTLAAAGE